MHTDQKIKIRSHRGTEHTEKDNGRPLCSLWALWQELKHNALPSESQDKSASELKNVCSVLVCLNPRKRGDYEPESGHRGLTPGAFVL